MPSHPRELDPTSSRVPFRSYRVPFRVAWPENFAPHILVTAPSNVAVDNIVSRILEEGFLDGEFFFTRRVFGVSSFFVLFCLSIRLGVVVLVWLSKVLSAVLIDVWGCFICRLAATLVALI